MRNRVAVFVIAVLAWALGAVLPDAPRTPRVIRFSQHQFVKRGHSKVVAGGHTAGELLAGMVRAVARTVVGIMNAPLSFAGWGPRMRLAGVVAVDDPMKTKRADLQKILGELKDFQKGMADKAPTQAEADAADAKVAEANALKAEIQAYDNRVKGISDLLDGAGEITDPALPPDSQPGTKGRGDPGGFKRQIDGELVVGYLSIGDYVAAQGGIEAFRKAGQPRSDFTLGDLPETVSVLGAGRNPADRLFVPVTAKSLQKLAQTKAIPTIGSNVIEPTRLTEIYRVTEHDELRLRDVLNVSQTDRDSIRYTRIVSYTRGAATVADGASKPESAAELDAVTVPVSTVAVWIPVQNQQLEDLPQLRGLIDNELMYDVDKHIEELVMYGDGTGEDFLGILNDPDVLAAREESGDTLIDKIRRGITDVRRAGHRATGVTIDPLDWETVVLEKGSDNRYVWVVVTEGGVHRLWGVPVVETVAMEDFQGNATEERNVVVGDWMRGATLWDRMRTQIMVGWQNDQFVKNQRTILCEARAAFGVTRPGAFRKIETQAAVAS